MKSIMEVRLECLRLANALGCAKNIPAHEVVPYAMAYFKWVDGTEQDPKPERLAERLR